ncbi:MAG: hypothetical protein KDB80_15560, partial [Planctomycetes bacterium]|nr:hypothetical protein [Planctomycetota bacterium]
MASLEIYRGERRMVYQILDDRFCVGASPDCAIQVADATDVARFERSGDGYLVRADAPGLEVNGEPNRSRVLAHGDVVRVGSVVLVYLEDGQPAPRFGGARVPRGRPAGP